MRKFIITNLSKGAVSISSQQLVEVGDGAVNPENSGIKYLTNTERDALTPTEGMIIWNITESWLEQYTTEWGWWAVGTPAKFKAKFGTEIFIDFGSSTISGGAEFLGVYNNGGNFTAVTNSSGDANRLGVSRMGTGTGATSKTAFTGLRSAMLLNGKLKNESEIYIEILSDASQRFQFIFGLGDEPSNIGASPLDNTNALYFLYDEGGVSAGSTASPNWQLVSAKASVRTFVTTSVPVVAGAWINLETRTNTDGTSATFFINGVSVGTITTNLPNTTNNSSIKYWLSKSIGTAQRVVFLDYLFFKQKFNAER